MEGEQIPMLENHFWQQNSKDFYYFQQDEAPSHKNLNVQSRLKSKFGYKFIDKDLCSSRSPDLNPSDYFFKGIS